MIVFGLTMTLVRFAPAIGADVSADSVKPDIAKVIEQRQQEIRKMSAAMKVVGRFLKNEGATLAEVAAGAEIIRGVAGVMGTGVLFPPGSAVGVDRSAARAEIWEHPEVFKEQARALATAAGHLAAAATAHDIATVRTRAAAVSGACAACHELFRQKLP